MKTLSSYLGWLVVALTAAGCVPFATPPARVSVGATSMWRLPQRDGVDVSHSSGATWRAGVHPLDVVMDPNARRWFDVGAGYQGETLRRAERDAPRSPSAHGPYLEIGAYPTLARFNERSRLRLGGFASGELLFREGASTGTGQTLGALLEFSHDVDGPFAGSGDDGGFVFGQALGKLSAGVFVNASFRQFREQNELGVSGGLSFRIPYSAGVACCAPIFGSSRNKGSVEVRSAPPAHRLVRTAPPARPNRVPARPRIRDQ